MTTDVFIRTSVGQPLRSELFQVTYARWHMETPRIHVMHGYGVREGRMWAETQADSDPYIYCDDDVLIVGKDWLKRAVDIVLRHKDYGAVSTLSLIESENLAVGEGEIYPMHAVGAPMIIRKGLMKDLPEMDLNSECSVIYSHLLSQDRKEGLLDSRRVEGLRHIHMGHGFSSNPALFWGF